MSLQIPRFLFGGVIFVESNGAGFPMEFLGDMTGFRIAGNLIELKADGRGAPAVKH